VENKKLSVVPGKLPGKKIGPTLNFSAHFPSGMAEASDEFAALPLGFGSMANYASMPAEERLKKMRNLTRSLMTVNRQRLEEFDRFLQRCNINFVTPHSEYVFYPNLHSITADLIVLLSTARPVNVTLVARSFISLAWLYEAIITLPPEQTEANNAAHHELQLAVRNVMSLFAVFNTAERDRWLTAAIFYHINMYMPKVTGVRHLVRAVVVLDAIFATVQAPRKTLREMLEEDPTLSVLCPMVNAALFIVCKEEPIPLDTPFLANVKALVQELQLEEDVGPENWDDEPPYERMPLI